MKSDNPKLLNGSTVHGLYGQKTLRHKYELAFVYFSIAIMVVAIIVCLSTIGSSSIMSEDGEGEGGIVGTIMPLILISPVAVWIVRALQYAKLRASSVRMSPTQFPEGYQMVVEAAQKFGMRKVPDAYVVLGNGVVNAFAAGHGYRRFIAVHSDIFEIGGKARDPEALRFVIGHEVGHIAAGHTSYFRLVFTTLAMKIPVFGTTLSRAQEYTADNYGYHFAPEGAAGTMGLLSAGKYLGPHVNFNALADRAASERGLWIHIQSWIGSHPINIWRAHALRDRSKPGRLFIAPRRETAQFAPLLPAASERTQDWPTPDEAVELSRTVKPAVEEEQFGRYPGVHYDQPLGAVRMASPNPRPAAGEQQL